MGDMVTVDVLPADLLSVCQTLYRDAPFQFEQLTDLCGVDYLDYGVIRMAHRRNHRKWI